MGISRADIVGKEGILEAGIDHGIWDFRFGFHFIENRFSDGQEYGLKFRPSERIKMRIIKQAVPTLYRTACLHIRRLSRLPNFSWQ